MKEKGVPINAVGLQGHWSIFEPTKNELEYTNKKITSLGLTIQVTEMDVSVYKWEKETRIKSTTDTDILTTELGQLQAEKYKMLFAVLRKYKQYINGITCWNISYRST